MMRQKMKILGIWIFATLLWSQTSSKQIKTWGPFKVILREPAKCDDEGTREFFVNATAFQFVSLSRSEIRVSGYYHSKIPLDDSLTLNYQHASWGNGGWKPNFLTVNFPNACTMAKQIYPDIVERAFELTNVTSCPIPAISGYGTITLSPDLTKPSLPAMAYNRYKASLSFVKDGEIKGCVAAIADVVPANNRG